MKLVYFLPFAILTACTSIKPQTIKQPLLNSISIGNMGNLNFDGHVGLPKFDTGDLVTYRCELTATDIQLTASSSDLDYVNFFCFNYQKYVSYIESLFKNSISFSSQKQFSDIKILWGDAIYQTSPATYVIRKSNPINDAVIFHELGHRLQFLLEENLKIPFDGVGFVAMGIIDYFAASIANDPVLGKDFAPPIFIRDIRLTKKYPKDLSSFKELTEKFYTAYSGEFNTKGYHKRFYQMFSQMAKENKEVEGHTSGMIISSVLWKLRAKFGHEKTDRIVAQSLMKLQNLSQFRNSYLKGLSEQEFNKKTIQWPDFLASMLILLKEEDASLKSCQFALRKFKDSGFDMSSKYGINCR